MSRSIATRIHDFAKQHTPAPFWGSWGRFRLPPETAELPRLLQSLFKLSKVDERAIQRIAEVDNRIGMRLALDPIHSAEFIELKFSSPSARAVETFDSDARQLAGMVRDCQDCASASCIGLAFAVAFSKLSDPLRNRAEAQSDALRELHKVFSQLAKAKMIGDAQILAFCQSVYAENDATVGNSIIKLLSKAMLEPKLFRRVIRLANNVKDPGQILAFIDFLNACEENHCELDRVGFVEQLESMPQSRDIVVEIGKLHFRSINRVCGHPFVHFRFPTGITSGTARAWRRCKNVDELQSCLKLLARPCAKTRIPYLSPSAQLIFEEAVRVSPDMRLNSNFDGADEKCSPFGKLIANLAGVDLRNKVVSSCFFDLVQRPKYLQLLLNDTGRRLISEKLRRDTSRENWVVATLVTAIGRFDAEEFSMISTCLCSGYLFDRDGTYCNPKTFKDFQAFIDSDILNLRAFLDPCLPSIAKSTGHVARLISYIRDFLVDPLNAHYTNFEIQRTKVHAQ